MPNLLQSAIDKDSPELVRKALAANGKLLNRPLPNGFLPAIHAAESGAARALEALLSEGAKTTQDEFDAFVLAARNGHIRVLEKISKHERVVPERVQEAMEAAALRRLDNIILFLLTRFKARVTPGVMEQATGNPPGLSTRARSAATLKLLIAHGGDVNARYNTEDGNGITLLHSAARNAAVPAMRVLLENGAEVNARDKERRTPLIYMIPSLVMEMEAPRALQLLLKSGADPSLTDSEECDALLHYLVEMHQARDEPDPKIIRALTGAGKGRVGATTALFLAIWDGDAAGARSALQGGAKLSHVCPTGDTPLTLAAGTGAVELVHLLLEAGADPNRAGRSNTALVNAARYGHLAVVKQLIAAGAKVNMGRRSRVPAADLHTDAIFAAEANRQYEVLDYLRALNAPKPTPAPWKPLAAGVNNWDDFQEIVVRATPEVVARALAAIIGGVAHRNVYGKTFPPASRGFVVARPKGMCWSNVLELPSARLEARKSETPKSFVREMVHAQLENQTQLRRLCRELALAAKASVITAGFSSAAGAATFELFDPKAGPGSSSRDKGKPGSEPNAMEQLQIVAETEKFVLGALHLNAAPGRPFEVAFLGYPAEAFEEAILVTAKRE